MKSKSVVLNEFKQLLCLKYANTTVENYISQVDKFIDFSDNTPLRVTNKDLLDYNIYLVKLKVSDSSRNVAISAIKLYFKLYLKKRLDKNVTIRPKKKKKILKQIPHDFLINKISNTKNLKAKLILTFGYGCGLRSDEVINLKRKDINLKEKYIVVNGKGSKQRIVPISDNTINLILEYGFAYKPKIYLFNGQTKPKYSSSSILKLVKQNIGNYRFHDLRHSFAMRLYQKGYSLERIKELLGHSNTKTTEIYAYSTQNMILKTELPM